jgi:DNA repair photolyase
MLTAERDAMLGSERRSDASAFKVGMITLSGAIPRGPLPRLVEAVDVTRSCEDRQDANAAFACSAFVLYNLHMEEQGDSDPFPDETAPDRPRKGRGAVTNRTGRFEAETRDAVLDEWPGDGEDPPPLRTTLSIDTARRIITYNKSPDIPFDRSINPYRGCEHGCVYCFARPTHAYMGLSPGLDFESKLFAKPDAARLLERELAKEGYQPRTIAIGTNTDPYQPIERQWRIMREILEVLDKHNHPVGIVTKSALVLRDIDILARMAEKGLAKVALSVTTLDRRLARTMEPRASTPPKRLEAIRTLNEAGVPASAMMGPVIPGLNDQEIERILESAVAAGAKEAGYVILRLPLEVSPIFKDWLLRHYPDRFRHVMSLVRSMRGGKDYDSEWGKRMKGSGPYAWQIGRRFEMAAKRLGLNTERRQLSEAGIPVSVMVAPVIPGLNDGEVERILDAARAAGAREAGYIILRLPLEVSPIFKDWLLRHYPDRYRHVLSLIRSMRGGKDYDAEWGKRMKGTGPYAWQIGRRFEIAARQLGLNVERRQLRTDLFVAPSKEGEQLVLL